MSTPITTSTTKASQDSKTGPESNSTEQAPTAPAAPKPYVPMTTKLRNMVGLQSDEDLGLLRDDAFMGGVALAAGAVFVPAGLAVAGYAIGTSYRNRTQSKVARQQREIEAAQGGNHSA